MCIYIYICIGIPTHFSSKQDLLDIGDMTTLGILEVNRTMMSDAKHSASNSALGLLDVSHKIKKNVGGAILLVACWPAKTRDISVMSFGFKKASAS